VRYCDLCVYFGYGSEDYKVCRLRDFVDVWARPREWHATWIFVTKYVL